MERAERADYDSWRQGLLQEPKDALPPGEVDAIMVPTMRNPARLATARDLADRLDCTLVTLHSRKWSSAVAATVRSSDRVRHVAVDVPDGSALRLPGFETTRLTTGTLFGRRDDTGTKRNFGLLLARSALDLD